MIRWKVNLFATIATFGVLAGAVSVAPRAAFAGDGTVPVIVELFTSEGCSSCPSADAELAKLAKTQPVSGAQIIALGYHVDYWNGNGWRDPFSSAAYSARQDQYRARFHNDNVYTPQMIVAGGAEFVGSDDGRARQEIASAATRRKASAVRVAVAPDGGDRYTVQLAGASASNPSIRVFVAVTEDGLASNVARGENAGRHLTHVAVVRQLHDFAAAPSITVSLPANTGENRAHQHIVAWAQSGETNAILGAAQIAR